MSSQEGVAGTTRRAFGRLRRSVNAAAATERTIIDQQGTRGRCASGVVLWCVRADIQAGLREGTESVSEVV